MTTPPPQVWPQHMLHQVRHLVLQRLLGAPIAAVPLKPGGLVAAGGALQPRAVDDATVINDLFEFAAPDVGLRFVVRGRVLKRLVFDRHHLRPALVGHLLHSFSQEAWPLRLRRPIEQRARIGDLGGHQIVLNRAWRPNALSARLRASASPGDTSVWLSPLPELRCMPARSLVSSASTSSTARVRIG